MRKGKHYLLTSGTTGYLPNPSEVAVADTWHGPYTVLGDPHPADQSHTSFHSQVSSVFQVPGKKDLYIAVADRWHPQHMDLKYEDYAKIYEANFAPDGDRQWALEAWKNLPLDTAANTSIADYVWLPLRFVEPCGEYPNGMVLIDWKDEWSLDDFE